MSEIYIFPTFCHHCSKTADLQPKQFVLPKSQAVQHTCKRQPKIKKKSTVPKLISHLLPIYLKYFHGRCIYYFADTKYFGGSFSLSDLKTKGIKKNAIFSLAFFHFLHFPLHFEYLRHSRISRNKI